MQNRPLVSGKVEIRGENVQVAYNRFVAFSAEMLKLRGRVIGVIGHNGSGKSTLLKALLNLLEPRQGVLETYWVDENKRSLLLPEKHMAFSPENGAIFEDMPVESYIRLWCRLKQHRVNYYKKEGAHYLEQLEIPPLLGKLGRELSKGQRRRVQAAVGFLSNPRLFLFDEPFDGLDVLQSSELSRTMLEGSQKMALIVSSHRMEVIERLADFILVLKDGKIFAAGGIDEICASLGGRSISISGQPEQNWLMSQLMISLQREFYSCLINQIGNQLLITGPDVSLEALRLFLLREQLQGLELHSTRPSLVDAMQCHLNKLH